MTTTPGYGADVDWTALATELADIRAHMTHHEETQYYGRERDAEELRRLLTGRVGRRWLTTTADAACDKARGEAFLRAQVAALEKEIREVRQQAAAEARDRVRLIAAEIRERVNDRTMPSRYRREGAMQVADWLCPKEQSGVPAAERTAR